MENMGKISKEDVVSDLPSPSALALQLGASKCQLLWSDLQLRRVLRRSAEPGEAEVEVLVEGAPGATGCHGLGGVGDVSPSVHFENGELARNGRCFVVDLADKIVKLVYFTR